MKKEEGRKAFIATRLRAALSKVYPAPETRDQREKGETHGLRGLQPSLAKSQLGGKKAVFSWKKKNSTMNEKGSTSQS